MDLNILLERTIEISKEAGAFIRKERQIFDIAKVEQKGINDLVSYVDKQAEQLIVDALAKLLPQAGFITEEGTSTIIGERYNWIIDPLDGTTNFIHGLPFYSVSIGLQENEEIILGVVYEVSNSECFYAIRDVGPFATILPSTSASPLTSLPA